MRFFSFKSGLAKTKKYLGYINLQLQNFDDAINDYSVFFNLTDQDFDKNSVVFNSCSLAKISSKVVPDGHHLLVQPTMIPV